MPNMDINIKKPEINIPGIDITNKEFFQSNNNFIRKKSLQ